MQYEVVLVNLDPTQGSEINKTRPCLILSPNEMNRHLQTMVIAPITNSLKTYPTRIEIKNNATTGFIVLDQIRTIDRNRIVNVFGSISSEEIAKVKAILKETYVD